MFSHCVITGCYVKQHTGGAASECLAELGLFPSLAGSGMLGRSDVLKVRSSFIFKVRQHNHRTVDLEDGDTKIFRTICNCLALDLS
jgi:hypothetical protein